MRRDLLLLAEMITAADRARELASGITLDELRADRQRAEALLWNFTVLGEAAAQVPEETRQLFPEIPWRQPARLRNRIVHGYWSVDLEILHTTAAEQLGAFASGLRQALATLTDEDRQASQGGTGA